MKNKKQLRGMKHEVREEKKREERISFAVIVTILIVIIFVSGFLINSHLNQPSTSPARISSTSEPKAVIVDQASLSPAGGLNELFIERTTNILKQAGFTVDYYPGEKVTVEFYRNLPIHGYGVIILRVHSAAAALEGKEYVEAPVSFFTSENYSRTKYVWEQLTEQLVIASYSMPEPPYYFGITPKFVTSSMKGNFQNSIIVMTGCEGLNNTRMAEAFIEKGAKVYTGWDKLIYFYHTDAATIHLLQQLLIEKQTISLAVQNTMKEVGPDPAENSLLVYYPIEAGNYTIQKIIGNITTNTREIIIAQDVLEKRKHYENYVHFPRISSTMK